MNSKSKKIVLLILFAIALFIILNPVVMANSIDYSDLCSNTEDGFGKVAVLIGNVINIVKWIIPLIIIVLGMVDFGKAVISDDDKAISKATATLIKRVIAGVIVFFIPTIILAVFNLTGITGDIENSNRFGACTTCILDVSKC